MNNKRRPTREEYIATARSILKSLPSWMQPYQSDGKKKKDITKDITND